MKKLISILLVLAMVMTFVPMTVLAEETTEKTTISVIAAEYGSQTASWWGEFESIYETQYPDVDLVVDVCNWGDIYNVVDVRIAAGEAPDILNLDSFAGYQADGLLLPVEDYMSDETYAKFYEDFLNQSKVDGKIWAVPDLTSARAMYYNKDMLEAVGAAVPTDWNEVWDACEKIKDYYGDAVIPWGLDVSENEGQAAFGLYTWNCGPGGFTDENGNWALNSPENVEIIGYMVSWLYEKGLTNGADLSRYDIQSLFDDGQVAMTIAPDSFRFMLDGAENGVNYGVAPIPAFAHDGVSLGVMDRMMCFDNGYSEEELAAVTAFFDLFYEDEIHLAWTQMEGFLPATSTAAALLAEMDPAMAVWEDVLANCEFYPAGKAEWRDVRNGVIEVLAQVIEGGDVQQLLDDLQAQITGTGDDSVQLDLWTFPVGSWSDDVVVSELIAAFEEANPGVTVEVTYLDYMTGTDKVNAAIEAGEAPDILMEGPDYLVSMWGEHMADLSDLLDAGDESEIYANALKASYGSDGSLDMYPLAGTVHTMAINKTVFEAAGAMQYIDEESHTWNSTEDFFKAVQAVYEYSGQTVGSVYCGGQGGDQGTRALVTNLYSGTYTNAEHTAYTWTSEPIVKALQVIYDCEGIEINPTLNGGTEIDMFRNGELNMSFCWNIMQQLNGDTTNSGDEIMFLAFPSDSEPALQGGIWGFGVFDNGDDARIEASKAFVQYMCDSEATVDAVKASGFFAVRDAADGADLSEIWAGDEINSEYSKMMPLMGDYYQVTTNWPTARACWWELLQDVGEGQNIADAAAYWNAIANGEDPGAAEEPGDMDGDGVVDENDVARLLWHTLFEDAYEIQGDADFNGDGNVDEEDVAYLLWHTLFPDAYPLV